MIIDIHPDLPTESLRQFLAAHGMRMRWHKGVPRVEPDPNHENPTHSTADLSVFSTALRAAAAVSESLGWKVQSLECTGSRHSYALVLLDELTEAEYRIVIQQRHAGGRRH